MIVGIYLTNMLIIKFRKAMQKPLKKTEKFTSYTLTKSNDILTLKNEKFDKIITTVVLSMDNKKIKNQISLF